MHYERTYDVLSSHLCVSDPRFPSAILSYHGWAWMELPPDLFDRIVYDCYTKDNIDDSEYAPLAAAVKSFVWSSPNLRYRWKSIIRHIISLEADLHRGCWRANFRAKGRTILDDLMNDMDGPFESRSVGQAWLDILTESGIDVVKYLRTEYQLHFDPTTALPMTQENINNDFHRRYLIISPETPSISWDWFIDPEGQAYDVLEEFKYFELFNAPLGPWPNYANRHWPIVYTRWQWFVAQGAFLSAEEKEEETIFVHRANDRFKRRCQKKAMKLAKAQGIFHQGPKMPGAWID
jgi:hypothetical protein